MHLPCRTRDLVQEVRHIAMHHAVVEQQRPALVRLTMVRNHRTTSQRPSTFKGQEVKIMNLPKQMEVIPVRGVMFASWDD